MPKLLRNLKAKMDQMGRAMKGPTADMAGRAMVAPPNRMNRPAEPGMGYKKGGMMKSKGNSGPYRKAADGIAKKGKTKGKEVKMRSGGYC